MSEVRVRRAGPVGRITLARPRALNALTRDMGARIGDALALWRDDAAVTMLVIDAEGDRAFCSGGDIEAIHAALKQGDAGHARGFWAEEYRLNRALFEYPKPVAAFLQGYTMGGGVGLGCHASHRVVGATSRIAMPECGIGLVPDAGGSLLLARAPGHLGEYLGLTGARMGPGDAIHAGFADCFVPEDRWPALIGRIEATGDPTEIARTAGAAPPSAMADSHDLFAACFAAADVAAIHAALDGWSGVTAESARAAIDRNAPLSMACALRLIRDARETDDIRAALAAEYRFTFRAIAGADFPEGIRAQIIDKDRSPRWSLPAGPDDVAALLASLGADELDLSDGDRA